MKSPLIAVALAFLSLPLSAEEVVLQQNVGEYQGIQATMIIAGTNNADLSYGGLSSMLVGAGASVERRALISFDLQSLSGAKVTEDAVLELTQANVRGFEEGTMEIGVYLVASANAGWKAGECAGAPATGGEATWNHRSPGIDPINWAGAPGLSKPGTDHSEIPLTTVEYQVPPPSPVTRIVIPKDVIQQWIDQPEGNAGILLKRIGTPDAPGGAMGGFYSPHHPKREFTPKLTIITDQ